jgi:glycerol dehydrogenase-like iron-containing ADH family enzyme
LETKGVYIQDVILPQNLVVVLTRREIATVLAEKGAQSMPQILAVGGGSSIDGLAATLTKVLAGQANLPSPPSLTTAPQKAQG